MWELPLWDWQYRFRYCRIYRTEMQPKAGPLGVTYIPVQVPCAIDRSVWWPLIERERWDHSVVFDLLETIEAALFGPSPDAVTHEEDDDVE